MEKVPTKFSKSKQTDGQTLVMMKKNKDDSESEARKFFTGSQEILYILQEIKKRDAFPRRVTMRGNGNRFWFE